MQREEKVRSDAEACRVDIDLKIQTPLMTCTVLIWAADRQIAGVHTYPRTARGWEKIGRGLQDLDEMVAMMVGG